MSNWEICRFLFLVFSSFRPAGDQLIQLDRSRCQMHLHPRACGSLLFFCLHVLGLSRFRPAGDQLIQLDRSRCQMHLHPRACGSLLFFCLHVLGLSRFRPAGDQLIQLDRSRCQTHLPHEPAALFFILESLRFKIKSTILVVFIDHRSVFLSKSCVFYGTLFANLLYLW